MLFSMLDHLILEPVNGLYHEVSLLLDALESFLQFRLVGGNRCGFRFYRSALLGRFLG